MVEECRAKADTIANVDLDSDLKIEMGKRVGVREMADVVMWAIKDAGKHNIEEEEEEDDE